ncbi:MAG: hypothetical protein R2861_07100 [Desulfobacterales bacterium]
MVLALFPGINDHAGKRRAAVTMAGIVMGNFSTYARQELMEFKEGLTVMLIGMLFVLAADVRISSILELGPAVFVVLALIFIVRPWRCLQAPICQTWRGGSGCLCPGLVPGDRGRGGRVPVCGRMAPKGVSGRYELRALVFLVITATVTLAGLTGSYSGNPRASGAQTAQSGETG